MKRSFMRRVTGRLAILGAMFTALAAGQAQAQSFTQELLRGVEQYLYDEAQEGLIKLSAKRLYSPEVEKAVEFFLTCKGAIKMNPAALAPCVAEILLKANDPLADAIAIKELDRKRELMFASCTNLLEKGLPEWRERARKAAEAWETFLHSDEVVSLPPRARSISRERDELERQAGDYKTKARAATALQQDLRTSAERVQASSRAEADAIRAAIAVYEGRKAQNRSLNNDAQHMEEFLKQCVQSGRISAAQFNEMINAYNASGQFPDRPPARVDRSSWNHLLTHVNRAEAELKALSTDIQRRTEHYKRTVDAETARLAPMARELSHRVSELHAMRTQLDAGTARLEATAAKWKEDRDRLMGKGRELRRELEKVTGYESLFRTCLANFRRYGSDHGSGSAEYLYWKHQVDEIHTILQGVTGSDHSPHLP